MNKLFDIQFDETFGDDIINNMYCRSDALILTMVDGEKLLKKDKNYDFFTYFNSLSIFKWRTYTRLSKFYLVLNIKGDFELYVFGHYMLSTGVIKKEYYCKRHMVLEESQDVIISIPDDIKASVVGFCIYTHKNTMMKDSYWASSFNDVETNPVNIALSTTTFKKENYIEKNILKLKKDLFAYEEYKNHFHWFIVDNGQTLRNDFGNENITVLKNPNAGGAGGFARGMIESISAGYYTHILLMDDDVEMTVESFKRLYLLLKYLRDEYKDHFISGAMLKMEEPNVQHEDIGVFDKDGSHRPAKCVLDLNNWDSIVKNESYWYADGLHYYAGWWFCCIPIKYVRPDNLPLPIFVRGDDVEYSLRNNPGFITMNGICIWHEEFEGKFSAALEFYQVERNDLIVVAIHDELENVDVIGRIDVLFWEEIYKFNYKGASLLLDAIEDYLMGPEYIFALDGGDVMKTKKQADNKLLPLTDDIRALIHYDSIYKWEPVKGFFKKKIYDYSYNGQARIPQMICKGVGIIPYGWGYFQNKMCLANTIYAVDLRNDKCVTFRKSRGEFTKLRKRHRELINKYKSENAQVSQKYRNVFHDVTSLQNWKIRNGIESDNG